MIGERREDTMATHSKNHKKVPHSVWKKVQNKDKAKRKYEESDKRDGGTGERKIYWLKPWKIS